MDREPVQEHVQHLQNMYKSLFPLEYSYIQKHCCVCDLIDSFSMVELTVLLRLLPTEAPTKYCEFHLSELLFLRTDLVDCLFLSL